MKKGLISSRLKIGAVARRLYCTHFGGRQAAPAGDLLPLPLPEPSVGEGRIFQAMTAGLQGHELRSNFSRDLEDAGRSCWLYLLVCVINYMALGHKPGHREEYIKARFATAAQRKALGHL